MTSPMDQYQNEKLWRLDESRLPAKVYVSVPVDMPPGSWKRRHQSKTPDMMIYTRGEYEIRGREYGSRRPDGKVGRRTFDVWRQGVEISTFYGQLKDAKTYVKINAAGRSRVNVA